MKEYVKPSVKLKTLAGNESLLDGSITEGVISNDTPGEGTPENPIIFEAPRVKSVWED